MGLTSFRALWLAAATVSVSGALAAAAQADTFEVTKRSDPVPGQCTQADCSLREAVLAANASVGEADRIVLPNRRRPYELQQAGTDDGALMGDLDITNDRLRIVHPGRGKATVDANGIDRVFEVFIGAPTTFEKVAIVGGDVTGPGGGIHAEARLRIVRSRVSGNQNLGSGGGIALDSGAGLQLIASKIANNHNRDAAGFLGGGISALSAGAVVIERSRLLNNAATGDGGALYLSTTERSRIVKSTIAGNTAPFAAGGAYVASLFPAPPVALRASTVSGNRAGDGGGLYVDGRARITNSTVANNRAIEQGGGIYGAGDVEANAVTVARNVADSNADSVGTGGGIYYENLAPGFESENSLIVRNRLGDGTRNDCWAHPADPFDSLGHNLLSTRGPAGACPGFDRPSDRVRANPKIARLRDNGGPTKTIALKRGSPAIGKADADTSPSHDQRGRKRDQKPDIGAFERR